MSSPLGSASRPTPRRLLATLALAAAVGLGASVSTSTGAASAAPAAPSSSSAAAAVLTAEGPVGENNRNFFVDPDAIERLLRGEISSYALAGQVCTAYRSGKACVTSVSYALRGEQGMKVKPSDCGDRDGYTVTFPNVFKSHCHR